MTFLVALAGGAGGGADHDGRSSAASGGPQHEFVGKLDQESRWLVTELERVLQLVVLAVLQLAQDGVRSLEPPPTTAAAVSKGTWYLADAMVNGTLLQLASVATLPLPLRLCIDIRLSQLHSISWAHCPTGEKHPPFLPRLELHGNVPKGQGRMSTGMLALALVQRTMSFVDAGTGEAAFGLNHRPQTLSYPVLIWQPGVRED